MERCGEILQEISLQKSQPGNAIFGASNPQPYPYFSGCTERVLGSVGTTTAALTVHTGQLAPQFCGALTRSAGLFEPYGLVCRSVVCNLLLHPYCWLAVSK